MEEGDEGDGQKGRQESDENHRVYIQLIWSLLAWVRDGDECGNLRFRKTTPEFGVCNMATDGLVISFWINELTILVIKLSLFYFDVVRWVTDIFVPKHFKKKYRRVTRSLEIGSLLDIWGPYFLSYTLAEALKTGLYSQFPLFSRTLYAYVFEIITLYNNLFKL